MKVRSSNTLLVPIVILILNCLTAIGAAQDRDSDSETIEHSLRFAQGIVVTPSRREESIAKVSAPVTAITLDEIKRSTARDIPELLRSHAGVHVVDITGNRRNYRIDLRGFGETASLNTLVLIDGRRATLPDLSGTDWLQIPLSRVDRIEVTRGGRGSVLYGDNATAGAINIITKGDTDTERTVSLHAGSYSSFNVATSLSGATSGMSYAIDGSYNTSDGYRDNGDTNGGDLGASLTVTPHQRLNIFVSAGLHSDVTGLPGELKESDLATGVLRRSTLKPGEFAEVDDVYVIARPRILLGDSALAQVDFSFRKRDAAFFSSFAGGTFNGNTTIETFTISPQINVSNPVGQLSNTLVVGVDASRSAENILNTTAFGERETVGMFRLKKQNTAFYLHDELFPHSRLGVSGGYRYDAVDYHFQPSRPAGTHFDQHLATVGVNFNITGATHLYASTAKSFRYPLLDELFNFFSNTIDTTLRPQRSNSYETGLRASAGPFFGELNYFHIHSHNELFFNPTGGAFGFGANENLDGPSKRQGVEVSAGGQSGTLSVSGNYTYTNARILEGVFIGRTVPNVPRHRSAIEFTFQLIQNIAVSMDGTYVGTRLFESDYQNAFGTQDSYVVVNLKLRHKQDWGDNFIEVRNLTDREYADYGVLGGFPIERAFFPSPGINVRVGTTLKF
jgi:iron complex outermembrane receptor protein